MRTDTFRGRDFITLLDWSKEEVGQILDLALDLKRDRAIGRYHDELLRAKTLFMIFYNQSLRTRNSFEAGMHQMGGHAHFLDPSKIYTPALEGQEVAYSTERVSDVARVLARMGEGIAIRCYGDPVDWEYGGANELIHEFARWSDIPVLNMEDDMFHPCQGIADLMTIPIQVNYDHDIGPTDDGWKWQTNVQPVIPFQLNEDWNLISRVVVPYVSLDGVAPIGDESGLGDSLASFFFSPKAPTSNGWIWGAGPDRAIIRRPPTGCA